MLIRYLFFGLIGLGIGFRASAQLSATGREKLMQEQDSLQKMSFDMINASMSQDRQKANDQFIPALVEALKIKYSYDFPFDSLKQVSILYDKDSTFRIFTWAISQSDIHYRFYGALQMNTRDGKLRLFPFFDNTMYIHNQDTITDNKSWLGALYYNMVETKEKGQDLYTLMGWCGFSFRTNKKVLDVLTFKDGHPVFGAPVFNFENDSVDRRIENRFFLEYRRDGNAGMNYNPNLNMIIYDHLTSLKKDTADKATLVPDGTYEGFKWEKGYWMHVPKVFHDTLAKPPIPNPLEFRKNIIGNEDEK